MRDIMGRNLDYLLHIKGADEEELRTIAKKIELSYDNGSIEKIIGIERISRLFYVSKAFVGWYKVDKSGQAKKTKNARASVYKDIYKEKIINSEIYVPPILGIVNLRECKSLDSFDNEAVLIAKNNGDEKDFAFKILKQQGFFRDKYFIEKLASISN
jgi:hypothetical protein